MPLYLILHDGKPFNAGRVRANIVLDYGVMRFALEQRYPGRTIKSPMEKFEKGDTVVSVYLSPDKNGVGRIDKFYEWLVGPQNS